MDIWEEMEEDLRKKYKQAEKGYQKPPTAKETLDMLNDINPISFAFNFMKYTIKHFIKQIKDD
jgi:hypothetical protein